MKLYHKTIRCTDCQKQIARLTVFHKAEAGIVKYGLCEQCNLAALKKQYVEKVETVYSHTFSYTEESEPINTGLPPVQFQNPFESIGYGPAAIPFFPFTTPPEVINCVIDGRLIMQWFKKIDKQTGQPYYVDKEGKPWKFEGLS